MRSLVRCFALFTLLGPLACTTVSYPSPTLQRSLYPGFESLEDREIEEWLQRPGG